MAQELITEDIVRTLPGGAGNKIATRAGVPTIRNCKILGFKSRNNRIYAREAMAKAAHKYENVPVNLDHNTGTDPRKFSERFGRIVNVKMRSEGLYGDLEYNPHHPLAEAFQWWVAHSPNSIGLSHNATAEVKNTIEGHELVTEIKTVDSVDLVADPATTKGLLESYNAIKRENLMPDLDDEMPELGPDAMNAPAATLPDPLEEADDTGEGDADFAAHLGNAILSIINDAGLDNSTKRKKVLLALKLMETDETVPEAEDNPYDDEEVEEDDDEADDMEKAFMAADIEADPLTKKKPAPALESVTNAKLLAMGKELDAYRVQEATRRKRTRAIRVCREAKLPRQAITKIFIGQLVALKEAKWATVIGDRKAIAAKTSKPISSPAIVAGDSYKSFVNALLSA